MGLKNWLPLKFNIRVLIKVRMTSQDLSKALSVFGDRGVCSMTRRIFTN